MLTFLFKKHIEQECIPVGCVPPARYRMGGSLSRGVSVRGVCVWGVSVLGSLSMGSLSGGLCLGGSLSRGVSVQGGLCPGVSLSGGLCLGGVSVQGGLPDRDLLPPPVNRMIDRQVQKHYLAATSLRAVITYRLNNGQLFHDSLSISHPHHSYCQRNCDNYRQSLWNCCNR